MERANGKLNKIVWKLIVVILSAGIIVALVISGAFSFGRYVGRSSKDTGGTVASLIVEMDGDDDLGNVVHGEELTAYFDIRNYNSDDVVTSVAYDCYIYVVDEDDIIISNAEISTSAGYETENKITQENPNYFKALQKVQSGDYTGAFLLEYVPPEKMLYHLRLKIEEIEATAVKIKFVAVQKESAD